MRYVKAGRGGRWWRASKDNGQVHLGWNTVPADLLLKPNFPKIKRLLMAQGGAAQDINALRALLDSPSKHVWVTFEDGCMWWCTVRDGATVNPKGESDELGHFWLLCDRPWSNKSLNGTLLAVADLPGTVTRVAGFRATVCEPKDWPTILRIIQDQKDPDATKAAEARRRYMEAVLKTVKRLSPKDFELLIDLILGRTGWARISTLGQTREGIDIEAENLTADEIAFVQVKGSATQGVLDDYVERFKERSDFYTRMIFAVHSPNGELTPPADLPAVQLWTGDRVAELVVRLGLGEWVERRIA
ncbi:MAG: restriction endonuclease [Bryobacteraceae bacterium]